MSAGWAWKESGSPWTLEAPHGVWAVSELRPGGRAELRYASFDKGGRLSVAPLAIGEFASARDARLTADLYEAEEPLELPEGIADALLPNGGVTEILAPDGRSFLLSLSGEAVTLTSSQGSARSEWARLDQPRVSTGGPEYARPPRYQEPAELDLAIMLRLVNLTGTAAK